MSHFMLPAARRFAAFVIVALVASGAVAEPKSRPFQAKLSVTETIAFIFTQTCLATGTVQASGSATHLGKVTATSTDCINPLGVFDPSVPNSFRFATTVPGPGLVLIAQNGDSLLVTYSGTLTDQPSGRHRIKGQFTIVGGTGTFVGAIGGGTLTGTEDISQIVSGFGEIEAIGTIEY